MKIIERFYLKEILKYTILAFFSLALIYLLIDFFESLSYFVQYQASYLDILFYYLYTFPSVISLLLSPALILAIFFVFGQAIRFNELRILKTIGITPKSLFKIPFSLSLLFFLFLFLNQEVIEIKSKLSLERLKKERIEKEKRGSDEKSKSNIYYLGENNVVYYIKELTLPNTMKDFSLALLDLKKGLKYRYDGKIAYYKDNKWIGYKVYFYNFLEDENNFTYYDSLSFDFLKEKPEDLFCEMKEAEMMNFLELYSQIKKFRKAGFKMDKEMVNFHSRFAYPVIIIVVTILSFGIVLNLKKGTVMLGLGIGLLISFLYWGFLQITYAMGEVNLLSPFWACWLPNIIFLILGIIIFLLTDKKF
jgi:lipopolysaccharide export system permease protein|uniref:YjgP/YjgQ family permease n=1 Tax=candidate division WOR-3 bacterium TaxID=2052148 RepID=A0A7V5XZI2_UNCW3